MPKSRILVIDNESAIRDSLRMTLEYEGYEFLGAATGQEGLALAEREGPDLVLLDVKMPGMDGLQGPAGPGFGGDPPPQERDDARRDDLRARHHQYGRRGDEEGRVQLHRQTI